MSLTPRGTISGTLGSLRHALRGLSISTRQEDKREEKKQTIAILSQIFEDVLSATGPFIDNGLHQRFHLELHHELSMDPFFEPWSASMIETTHTINISDKRTVDDICLFKKGIDHGISFPFPGEQVEERLSLVTDYLASLFSTYPRKPHDATLRYLSGWRYSSGPGLTKYSLPRNIDGESCETGAHWYRSGSKSSHVKLLMFNTVEGQDGVLAQKEALAIIGLMIHGLKLDNLKEHVIVPVMLVSFMGSCHGRILIAHFDGSKLVIRMSKFHLCYSDQKQSYVFFLRYLAAREGENGDTKTLLSERRVPAA